MGFSSIGPPIGTSIGTACRRVSTSCSYREVMKTVTRRISRLEDRFTRQRELVENLRARLRIVVARMDRPLRLETSRCRRMLNADGSLTEVVRLDGNPRRPQRRRSREVRPELSGRGALARLLCARGSRDSYRYSINQSLSRAGIRRKERCAHNVSGAPTISERLQFREHRLQRASQTVLYSPRCCPGL